MNAVALEDSRAPPAPQRQSPVGYEYVHSLIDDHSRLAYSEILPSEKGVTCAEFLRRAAAYFAAFGIAHIERVMTDNAWAYRYSLRDIVAELAPSRCSSDRTAQAERQSRASEPHPPARGACRQPFASNTARAD